MYIDSAVSMKSEKDAYMKALVMITRLKIDLESIKLDRYYSGQSILEDFFKNTRIFIIPKKNSRIRGSIAMERDNKRFQKRSHCIPEGVLQKKDLRNWILCRQEINRAYDIPEEKRSD